ncbi:MAG: CocE/NonD family hydrolase [Acidobacteria bacterium]|nr:CocE/NonD family hydrolase [Acidobacteriota bacterium]
MNRSVCLLLVCTVACGAFQPALADDDDEVEKLRKKLEEIALVDRKMMVPMRDGVRLATDVYRPKDTAGPLPTILHRTPYNFNTLSKRRLESIIAAVERGYAFIIQNERGKFFSEGEWEILGLPRTDGWDTLDWLTDQPWSNGKVGTIGCSSSAEWQLALAAMEHPAHAAMVPMASGAGIGRVGDFVEQGNWYRGGVYQMLFGTWLYGVQNTQRPRLPTGLPREDVIRLSRYFDLAPEMPDVDWTEQLKHLPLVTMMEEVEGPQGIYAELIQRLPADPAWNEGGLYQDDEPWGVPSLWMNSWYDVSIGPNLALFNHVIANAEDPEVADNQYVVIAPTPHCRFQTDEEQTIVGARDMGDVRLDYDGLVARWFDYWLKGEDNGVLAETPKVQYYTMGLNRWQSSSTWPPAGVETVTWYLDSGGAANSLFGDGRLVTTPPTTGGADRFTYDPQVPVPSLGGGVCCIGDAIEPGSFDQRGNEARHDVLVYTSEPMAEAIEISGTIGITLYVGSDARDTDFSVKLIDLYPDGTAYNLDETIQRARFREGYDRQVFMEPGEVYELEVSPLSTSALIDQGHRLRVEISSSNFPRFARNLNTGGNNWEDVEGVVAHNSVHHSAEHPSQIRLPIVKPQ